MGDAARAGRVDVRHLEGRLGRRGVEAGGEQNEEKDYEGWTPQRHIRPQRRPVSAKWIEKR
jgi:hypothetical protein